MTPIRTAAATAIPLCAWIAVASAAAKSAPAEGLPDDGIVRIDAIVTATDNRPLHGLKPSDIEVVDAGGTVAVDSIDRESSLDGRLIAIFLDEYHVQDGDHAERVRAALTQFVDTELGPADRVAVMKPLDSRKTIEVAPDRDALRAAIAGFSGRKGDYAPRTPFEENFMGRAPAAADASRAVVAASALQALAQRVGAVRDGRKAVIVVSEGFSPPPASLQGIVYAANRYGVSFYIVNPGTASAGDDDANPSSLKALARETGGEESSGTGLLKAMKRALLDLDDYYVLSYRPPGLGDGRFHAVEIKVRRAGGRIRARSGYWSVNPAWLSAASMPKAAPVYLPARPPHASPFIRPWIGTTRAPDGQTRVMVSWQPGQPPPRNQQVASVRLKATSNDGRVLFEDRVGTIVSFETAPGPIHLEMTVLGEDGRALDSDYRNMVVPNLNAARLAFSTLQIVRTRNAREFASAAADPDISPVASREFSRAERLLLRLPIYGIEGGDTPLTATATLMNRVGTPMRALARAPGGLPDEIVQFDLPLSSLPPGDYRVEFVARASGQETRSLLLFRVTD